MVTAGIDIGKYDLVAAVDGREGTLKIANDGVGWTTLLDWLRDARVERVGMEASGGYERAVLKFLRAERIEAFIVDPAAVRAFARVMGKRAKSDAIDAAVIARFTAGTDLEDRPEDPRIEALREELLLLEHIEEDRARWKTRRERYRVACTRRRVDTRIRRLGKERDAQRARLRALLHRHDDLARRFDLLLSIPGIGERTAIALLIHMPELGSLTREKAAALVGVAPYDRDSGTVRGKRRVEGGRRRLRRALYNAAAAGAQWWNPELKAFYTRLRSRGKPHTLAVVACTRKLAVFANTVLQKDKPWEKYPVAQ